MKPPPLSGRRFRFTIRTSSYNRPAIPRRKAERIPTRGPIAGRREYVVVLSSVGLRPAENASTACGGTMQPSAWSGCGLPLSGRSRRANLLQSLVLAESECESVGNILNVYPEASRTSDWASPARSGFTTFCHRKVAPKVSAGHLRRDRTKAVTERRCRHPLLFAVLDLLVLLDQDKSTRRKKMHDRRNLFSGKNSDAKISCVVSAGRRPWDTPTVAGLRRRRLQPARRKGPQYFKPDCGVSQGRNLACTARCSVNSRKVRSSRRFPPVPLRSDRHDEPPPDIPKGNRHTERSTRPPINNGNRFL